MGNLKCFEGIGKGYFSKKYRNFFSFAALKTVSFLLIFYLFAVSSLSYAEPNPSQHTQQTPQQPPQRTLSQIEVVKVPIVLQSYKTIDLKACKDSPVFCFFKIVLQSYKTIDLKEYIKRVMDANPAAKINEQDYREIQLAHLRELQTYSINLALNGSASAYVDEMDTGARISLDATKILYDGGKKQILEKEYEVVQALSKANLLANNDILILTALVYYSDFYYRQEVLDFLKEQFELQKSFTEKVENSFQKGTKFSTYDYLTSQTELLKLEKDFVNQKSNFMKTDIAFRQFGHIYDDEPLRLSPLDIAYAPDMENLQRYSLVHNHSIQASRLREDLQKYKIAEREAEGGLRINARSSLGIEAGRKSYVGDTNIIAGASLDFSLPLYDGGARKSEILIERIRAIKQKLSLQKATEDVIKKINDVHVEYKALEHTIEILEQQLTLNEKRLKISIERLEKGLEDYRAVRESWTDLIATKIELIQLKTLSQKLFADMLVLSGLNIVN